MSTVRNRVLPLLTVLAVATPLAAQAPARGWAAAKCDLKPGHFLVNGGVQYLKSASETRFEDQREKDLRDAQRVLTEALTQRQQEKNPAAWYYLGRYHVIRQDAAGADTAFARAVALKPECGDDIGAWRRVLWVPTFNAGVAAWQAGNTDSAIAAFRRANTLLSDEPTGFKYIATLFFNTQQPDSAVFYFRRAAEVAAKDPKFAQDRKDALYNLGRIQHSLQRWDQAEATYREYLTLYPNDAEVLAALGSVQMQRGQRDSAFAIYKQIIGLGDSVGYVGLFRAGVEISQSVPDEPDTAAAASSCRTAARAERLTPARIRVRCDSVTKAMVREHETNAREAYTLATQALDASLKLNPHYRESLIHRTNTALGTRDSVVALAMARRLVAVDPLNRTSLRMMAFAQQQNGKIDSTLHYLRLADSTLAVDITVSQFDSTEAGTVLKGLATNLRNAANQPFNLVFDFVNSRGEVLATDTVQVPAIPQGQTHAFELKPAGSGIVAWRYKKG